MNNWDKRFLDMAHLVAGWSKDPSTGCGCAIAKDKWIVSLGFNGYPAGIEDTLEDQRELKYEKTIHAEINAILHAKTDLTGCTLYVTPLPPCSRCAAVIIQSGISRIVVGVNGLDLPSKWAESYSISSSMLKEAGIPVIMETVNESNRDNTPTKD